MKDPKLWVAVLGVLLSSLSLGWQAATYVLTGGRVKVRLRVGAMSPTGHTRALGPPDKATAASAELMAKQGLTRPVVAIEVVNVGRHQVTVTKWALEHVRGADFSMAGHGEMAGPPIPHTLEAGGEPATWLVDLFQVKAFREAGDVFNKGWDRRSILRRLRHRRGTRLSGVVELADGRRKVSKEAL